MANAIFTRPAPSCHIQMDEEALARADEKQYVHAVYDNIAEHFSKTRYKVGRIPAFLDGHGLFF